MAPLLLFFMLAATDVGGAVLQGLRLQQAVRAGAVYAMQWPTDSNGITQVITGALPSGWSDATITVPAAPSSCACWSQNGGVVAAPSCTCNNGASLQKLLQLSVSRPYSPLLLKSITTTGASDVIRYQ